MSVRDLIAERSERYLGWLTEACSIPSLAEDETGLEQMSSWLETRFSEVGAVTERLRVGTAPDFLLASMGTGGRSLLVYDHYDVQPAEPLELWLSKPFSPEIRNGIFYARGAADNKGDLVARLAGLEIYGEVHGNVPFELEFLVEGEEEVGSGSFEEFVARHGHKLEADGCIWEGAGIDHAGRPEFVFGAKGMAFVELVCRGLNEDQHSSLAVIAPSPVWRLVHALTTLRDDDGRVLIEGFYDDALPPTEQDQEMLRSLPFDDEAEKRRLGIDRFVGGDSGIDLLKRYFFQPTCNIAGISGGFTVPGSAKTVLPMEARVKIDMRLVPDQVPEDIVAKLRKHLDTNGFNDVEIASYSTERPVRSPVDSLVGRSAIQAAEQVYSRPPAAAPMMIGTGPMHPIAGTLAVPTVSPAGVCRPESNIHAPNENVRVEDFLRTIEFTVAWMDKFASLEG